MVSKNIKGKGSKGWKKELYMGWYWRGIWLRKSGDRYGMEGMGKIFKR